MQPDVVEMLEYLSHPSAEAMPDSERLTLFVRHGFDAAQELKELRARLAELEATLKHM